MANTYKFTTSFQGTSQLPEDRFVNTWHFYNTNTLPPTDFDNVRDMLRDFWTVASTGSPLVNYLTNTQITSTCTVKAYNYDDTPPRAPVYESSFTLTGLGAGSPLPTEMAVCLSYQAAKESGLPQGRRRNRIYLGPFNTSANDTGGRPASALRTAMIRAITDLEAAAQASVSWDWVVYSPTNADQYVVNDAWVDNAWDTQRRRGLQPTSRNSVVF